MLRSRISKIAIWAAVAVSAAALSGCGQFSPAYMKPLPAQTRALMVKKGMTCREIASLRGMGVKSVENTRVALRRKLGVDRRVNLRGVLQEYGDL